MSHEPPAIRGLTIDAVTQWLTAHVPEAAGGFEYSLIAAGGSNLTYRVTDRDGGVFALRRPPEGTALATAHDVDREWRIISALHRSGSVPVPRPIARCDDASITGAPFYVMDFVAGPILRTVADTAGLDAEAALTATHSLIDAQVAMHTIDLDASGLADLGRHDGYVERQLKRWRTQVKRADARPVPLLHELYDALATRVPAERVAPALAHGDYRFDNVVLRPDWSMGAVLDWELCTTGNPLADFAWSTQYWADPGDAFTWLPDAPTTSTVFPRSAEVIDLYTAATGFDLSDYPFYEAFSWWKQACIVEGVFARRLNGSQGGMHQSGPASVIADRVDIMLEHTHRLVADLD
jgi:aminoglycoside phosphotransferase (APT) family kinase protein